MRETGIGLFTLQSYLDDGTIRLYDLRTKSQCLKDYCNDDILIRSQWGITSMDINPMNHNEIVCSSGDSVRQIVQRCDADYL